jgi:hypothetical protein
LSYIVKDIPQNQYGDELRETLMNYDERIGEIREKSFAIIGELISDNDLKDVFERPVTEEIAAGYFNKISYPMDFCTIIRRLGHHLTRPFFIQPCDVLE